MKLIKDTIGEFQLKYPGAISAAFTLQKELRKLWAPSAEWPSWCYLPRGILSCAINGVASELQSVGMLDAGGIEALKSVLTDTSTKALSCLPAFAAWAENPFIYRAPSDAVLLAHDEIPVDSICAVLSGTCLFVQIQEFGVFFWLDVLSHAEPLPVLMSLRVASDRRAIASSLVLKGTITECLADMERRGILGNCARDAFVEQAGGFIAILMKIHKGDYHACPSGQTDTR